MIDNPETYWPEYAEKILKGRKIVSCRYMTTEEAEEMGWNHRPVIIQLDDGTIIFPSRDDEGNNGGALFGQNSKGKDLTFPVL